MILDPIGKKAAKNGSNAPGRRHSEDELRETSRILQAIVDASPLAVVAVNTEGKVTHWSSSAERMFGWSREETLGLPNPIVPDEQWGGYEALLSQVLSGDGFSGQETKRRRKDGTSIAVSLSAAPLRNAQGQVVGSMALIEDITAQKQAEDDLRNSEARYRVLINEMTEGVALHELLCDEDGRPYDFRFLELNPAFERLTGLKREEVIGRRVSEVLPDEAQTWVRLSSEVALTGRSAHFENYVPSMQKHFEVFAYSPEPLHFAVLFADITERKRGEQERDRLLSQLRAIIDHLDTGLIISDVQGRILEMNPAARILCGYTATEQIEQHSRESSRLFELLRPDGEPLALEDWPRQRTLRGETFSNWELRVRRKADGMEGMISYGGTPVRDKTGDVIFTVVTLRDVTERWKAQEVLEGKVRERTAELDRFNRTLQAIIDCDQAIIRASSEQDLLQEFCRISMEVEGIDLAWVGLAEQDEARSVRVAASVGFQAKDLSHLRISWADGPFGQGPASQTIRTGRVCIRPCLPTDPRLVIRKEADLNLGFGATIALPLQSGSRTFGALVLSTARPELFDENQIRMLRELSNNLSISLNSLRAREERDRALRTAEAQAEQLRALSLELAQTEQRERRRLAQILHDDLQQLLVGATFHIRVLESRLGTDPLQKTVERLTETISEALEVSRAMTMELSPPLFYEKGLSDGLEWLATQMHRKHGLEVAIETIGNIEPGAEQIRMFLFEATRELLLNVVKHAKVAHARVRVRPLESEELEVTVSDGGIGFDPAHLEERPGFGLFSIREKLRFLHGRLAIESVPEGGSRFTLVVPAKDWRQDRDPTEVLP